ncbi:Eco57I restriction-modification methylase domain-containing protein [Campylobacter upsaliensis]
MPEGISTRDLAHLKEHFSDKFDKEQREKFLKLFNDTKQNPHIVLEMLKNGELRKEYIKAYQHKESKDLYYIAISKDERDITGIPTTQIQKVINDIARSERVIKEAENLEGISNTAAPFKNETSPQRSNESIAQNEAEKTFFERYPNLEDYDKKVRSEIDWGHSLTKKDVMYHDMGIYYDNISPFNNKLIDIMQNVRPLIRLDEQNKIIDEYYKKYHKMDFTNKLKEKIYRYVHKNEGSIDEIGEFILNTQKELVAYMKKIIPQETRLSYEKIIEERGLLTIYKEKIEKVNSLFKEANVKEEIKQIIDNGVKKGRDMQILGEENFTPEVVEYIHKNKAKVAIDKLERSEAENLGFKYSDDVRLTIDSEAIQHTLKRHGAESDLVKNSGQIPVEYKDIAEYRNIVKNADESLRARDNAGNDVIVSYRQINGYAVVVEQIRKKNNELSFKTMFKQNGDYKNSKSYKETSALNQTLSIGYEPSANSFSKTEAPQKADSESIAQNAKEQSLFNDIIQENEGGNHNAKQNQRNEFERVERTMQNDTGGTLFKGELDKEKSHDKRGASGGSVIHSTRDELTAPQILQESDTKNSKRGSTGASGRGYTAGEENEKSIRMDDSKRSEQISTDENHLRENNTGSYDNERYKQANNVQSSGRLYKKPIRSNGGLDNRNLPQQILNKKWSEALEKRGILSPLQNAQKEAKKEQATQKYTFTESANEKQILEDNYKALEGLLNLEKIRKYKIEREKFEAKYSKAEYFSQADVKAITKHKESVEDLDDKALMKLLANFKGFGKATNALLKLKGEEKAKWDNMLKDLSKALGVKINIADLVQRSKDAYYTPDKIIEKMVKLVDDFAKNANKDLYDLYKLEPSAGIGRFFNHLPIANSYAVEKDRLSAKMSEYLYEGLKVDNSGYENSYFKLENQFDLVIGNPPYANFKIGDDTFKENIHNYFMKKNVDNLRADGISLQIITHNFMDAKNPYTRDLIAKDAEFLGAVRLPNTTFKDASVTTDIIAFRKRNAKDKDFDTSWAKSVEIEKDVWVNQYFLDNPQNVLGKMEVVNSQFGRAIAVKNENFDLDSLNLSDFIKSDKAFKSKFDFDSNSAIYNAQYELYKRSEGVSFFQSARGGELRYDETNGRFVVLDDNLKEHDFNVYEKIAEAKPDWKESFIETKLNALKEMMPKIVKVKEALFKLKEAELNPNASDEKIEILRRILNKAYDELQGKNGSFRNAYGKISQKWQMYELLDDTSFELFALEKGAIVKKNSKNKSEVKGSEKSDIFYKRVTKPYVPPTHANTLMDAVNISKAEKGVIDLERLTGLLGKELEEVEKELLESKQIYKDHNGKNIEKDEFLSGNIREKIARFYDENGDLKLSDDAYIKNLQLQSLEDLKNIIPEDIELPHINIPLGANWLEREILERFFKEELDLGEVKLRYFDKTWLTKGRFEGSIEITTSKEYAADTGIKAINGVDYILKMMNNESLIFALSFRSIIYRLCAFSLKFHAFCMSLSSMLVRLFCR